MIGDLPLAVVSKSGKFLDVNDAFANALGYTTAELLDVEFDDIVFATDSFSGGDIV